MPTLSEPPRPTGRILQMVMATIRDGTGLTRTSFIAVICACSAVPSQAAGQLSAEAASVPAASKWSADVHAGFARSLLTNSPNGSLAIHLTLLRTKGKNSAWGLAGGYFWLGSREGDRVVFPMGSLIFPEGAIVTSRDTQRGWYVGPMTRVGLPILNRRVALTVGAAYYDLDTPFERTVRALDGTLIEVSTTTPGSSGGGLNLGLDFQLATLGSAWSLGLTTRGHFILSRSRESSGDVAHTFRPILEVSAGFHWH